MRFIVFALLIILAGCQPKYKEPPVYYSEPVREAPPVRYQPVQKTVILIDPGHGGEDEGTKSLSKPVYSEKSFNLITAKFLSSYLKQMGYQPVLTRTDDTFISLKGRFEGANNMKPALFVSVHYNAAPAPEANGVEVFYYRQEDNPSRTQSSKKLAQSVLAEVIAATGAKSRNVKHGDYAVIRETEMPAILIEGGFLSNEEELQKIKDPNYLKKVAWGIAQGIDKYLAN